MNQEKLELRVLALVGLVLSALVFTTAMLTFVQAQEVAAAISIAKEADQTVVYGATATFTITIRNTGDVTLTNLTVSDALAPDCNRSVGTLADLTPGQSRSYECARTNVMADFTNSATVAGTDTVSDTVVSDTDEAVVHVISPGIEVVKTADPTVVNVGDTVNYTITVRNTGDSDLTDVNVDDGLAGCTLAGPDGDDGDLVLETDEAWTYTCSVTAGDDNIVNTASVTAIDESGGTVTGSASVEVGVLHPAIEVAKMADPTVVNIGDPVTYTIAVDNAGDSDLTDVAVDDGLTGCTLIGPGGDDGDRVLQTYETWTYTCSVTAGNDDIVNTAIATAVDQAGGSVSHSDTATVTVIHPGIRIAKTPDVQTVTRGSAANFTIAVTNTGDVGLRDVTISDAQAPGCAAYFDVLDVEEGASHECALPDVQGGLINSALVTGRTLLGRYVTNADAAKVRLDNTLSCPAEMGAYWKLDEASGPPYRDFYYGREGECAGNCPTPATGRFGDANGAQAFDGNTTGIAVLPVPGDDSFNWGAHDSFSVEFWMKANSANSCSADNEVIIGRDDTPLHWWVGINCRANGEANFTLVDNNGTAGKLVGTTVLTDGLWYHIVAVRDGSANQNRLYVNGTLEDSRLVVYTAGFESLTAALNIGWLDLDPYYRFDGVADELALYDRALSPDEIRQHHNEGLAGLWYCQSGTYAPVIVSTPVAEAVSGRPYIYDVEAVGNPVPTYTLTVKPTGMTIDSATGLISWMPTVAQEGGHDVEVQASNSEGAVTQSFTILVHEGTICPADMFAYWKLDETDVITYYDFYDSHDGTCMGQCPVPVDGYVNGGQEFDGATTGIDVSADEAFNWGAHDSFSVEFWMKADSANSCSADNEVIIGRDDTPLHWWVGINCRANGEAGFTLADNNGNTGKLAGTTVLTDGLWYHIVAVRDGSANQNRLYVNGTLEDSRLVVYTAGFESLTAALNIGWLDLDPYYHFDGVVDELALYNRALSLDEIRRHYNEGESGPGYCINPDITIKKTANPAVVYPRDLITYTYTVSNTGDATLSDVRVSDDKCDPVTPVEGDNELGPGEHCIFCCLANLDEDTTNTATATGSHSLDGVVTDTHTISVDVINPRLAMHKTAGSTTIDAGDTVTYTYTVTNTGDDPLSSVSVSDDKCFSVTLEAGGDPGSYELNPGEVWTYTCSTILSVDTTNIATVTGTDSVGGTWVVTDTAFVDVKGARVYLPLVLRN